MNTKILIGAGIALAMAGCASTPSPTKSWRAHAVLSRLRKRIPMRRGMQRSIYRRRNPIWPSPTLHSRGAMSRALASPPIWPRRMHGSLEIRGAAKADDARVAAGQAERDSIVLAARTNQVDSANRAKDAADRAASEANRATDDAKVARDQATENAARLQAEVDALKAKPTDRGLVLTLGDVLFETGSSTLSSGAGRNMDRRRLVLPAGPVRIAVRPVGPIGYRVGSSWSVSAWPKNASKGGSQQFCQPT